MMIDANLLPFSVDELVKSKAWHDATPEQRRKFISAGVTFDSVLTHYADKYRAKKTIKGEFISCVLWDFYYDLFCNPLEQGNGFDFELGYYYENNIDNYSERLLDEAIDPKRWIKVLKQAYRENKEKIIEGTTDKNGEIDLDLVNDFSVEYRDYLYQKKEILVIKTERKRNFRRVNKMGAQISVEQNKVHDVEEFTSWIEDWTPNEEVQASQIEAFNGNLDYVEKLVNKGLPKEDLIKKLQDLVTYVATDSHNA